MKSSSDFLQSPLKLSSDVFGEVKACAISMLSLHPANRLRAKKRCCADVERLQICSLPALDLGSSWELHFTLPSFCWSCRWYDYCEAHGTPSVSSTLLMFLFSSGSLFWRTSGWHVLRHWSARQHQLWPSSPLPQMLFFYFGSCFWNRICAWVPGHEETYLATFIEKMEKGGHGASHLAACILESFEGIWK